MSATSLGPVCDQDSEMEFDFYRATPQLSLRAQQNDLRDIN